jgi:hypothetical protein
MFLLVELKTEERSPSRPAVFELRGDELRLERKPKWLSEKWLEAFLSRQPRIGAENFIETKDGEMIVRGLVEVSPSDSRYLEAWRQEFERAGFYAEIADEKRARLWENIRGSEIDRDIQDQVVYGIQRLPDEAVRQIEKELEGLKKSSLSK